MKHLYPFIIVFILSGASYGQKNFYKWSYITRHDRSAVHGLSIQFFDAFNKKELQKIRFMLPASEISYRGCLWMSIPRFSYLLSKSREKGRLDYSRLNIHSFDDCTINKKARNAALKHLRIFNNNSILVTAPLKNSTSRNNKVKNLSLVFQKSIKDKKWKIISIYGFQADLDTKSQVNIASSQKGWRTAEIHQLNLTLLIPPGFSGRKNHGSFISWSHNKNTQQEAVLQVMAAKSSNHPLEEGRQWLKRFLKNRRYTTVQVMLHPQGYRFELEMIDRDAKKNKVIISALKNGRYTVFVAFLGYLSLYEKMHREIDFTMRNLLID